MYKTLAYTLVNGNI